MSNEKALSDLRAKLGKKNLDNVYVKLLQDARAPKLDVRDLYVNLTIVQQREVKKVSKTANSSHSEEALFLRVHERLRGVAKDRVASTRAQSLEELLRSSARELDDDDIGTVMEFLRHNADWEKVLFVIDGIDEGCIMDSVLYRLITRDLEDISPHYLLLLTARPCPTIHWLWEVGDIDPYLSLRGFDQVSRADFFERYGSLHYGPDWSSMRRNLTVFLRKLDSLHVGRLTYMYLPFMATLCVHAMPRADRSSLPHCATQLLQLLVMALLKRDLRSGPGRSRQFSQFAHLRGPQQEAMQEMAAFAYRMTAERAMVVEDDGDDSPWSGLAADVSEEFESLISCLTLTFDETGTEQSLTMRQFVHLTIQELLCAYHIVRQLQEEDGTTSFCECFSAVVRATNFGEQFTHLLVYVSGLAPPGQHALVLHTIMTLIYREDQELPSVLTRSKRTLMLFKMLSEAYQATTGLRQEHAVDIKEMSCSSWAAIATAIAMFASNWVQIPMERNYQESDASDAIVAIRLAPDQFTGVRHIFAGRCHSVTSTEVYDTLLQCQRNCSTLTLRLTKEDDDRDGLRTLSSLVAGSRLLREVDMKSDNLHAFRMESLERVAAAFESTESLRTIRFQYALLEDTTLHRIMTAISSSNKLQKLSIGIISEKLWSTMCSLIKACSSITHLHVEILWRSSINVSAHSRRLCQALECNTSLKEFAILGSDQRRSKDTRPLANDLVSVFAAHPTIELFCLGCRFLNLRNDSLVEAMDRLITRLASQEKFGKRPFKTLVIIRSGNIADEGIRRCLELVQASPGVTLQVDSMYDGGISDELPSLRDNFPFFLSISSIWWRKDSHHPRYSSKGLDELATMLEPERTQKEHDASNEANEKTTAEHQEDDPWLHPYYLDHYRDRILCIDPELLRLSTQSQGLLDNSQYVDLRTVQSAGALVHNQRCLEYARTFTKVVDGAGATDGHDGPASGRMEALSEPAESFQRLLRALEHMGYRALRVEMEERMFKLHPDTGVPTLQMDDVNKPVDPWQHEGFDMRFHAWILSLPSGTLRAHSQAHGILTLFMVASLVSVESRRGSLAHNDTYLIYIRPNGVQSFVKFLNVIQGNPLYRLRVKEMSCFLPVDLQEPFLEESDNG
ncbi:uncharacterized protein LOC135826626 [Sycon ciliatum]|uniref:uncharacterized protein LOC135826626 n=1 Tax=Sycon ciliatum TaxID=27933 RepID=UPI0031F648AE